MEVQRAQKALMEATKDNKDCIAKKRHEQKDTIHYSAESNRRETLTNSGIEIHMSREDALHIVRNAQDVGS